jgi:hypothetical protein
VSVTVRAGGTIERRRVGADPRARVPGSQITHRLTVPSIALRLAVLTTLLVVGGCGSAPSPTPIPTPVATPTPTPDAHLGDPTTGNLVYSALAAAGLRVVGNSANSGVGGAEPRRRINATFGGWPLIIEEYSSGKALEKATDVGPSSTPRPGDPPYAFTGLNIRIEFGPKAEGSIPSGARGSTATAAAELALALDAIIGPLRQVAVVPVSLPTPGAPPGSASPGPGSATGGGTPTASPAPGSATPSP